MAFNKLVNVVARFYGIKPKDILGRRRTKDIVSARQVVCFLAREKYKKSFPNIARNLGKYDHTTVLHSYRKITEKMQRDEVFKDSVNKISEVLNNASETKINSLGLKRKKNIKALPRKDEISNGNGELLKMFKNEPANIVRQTDILKKYKEGFTLQEIGKIYNLSRERIRQIVMKALFYEAYKIFNQGIELDLSIFISKNLEGHSLKLKERRGPLEKLIEVIRRNEPRWSRYYDRCRMCGTKSIKHASYGYCKWCYTKSDDYRRMQKESWLRNKDKRKKQARKYNLEYQTRPEVIARIKRRTDLKMFGGNREAALKRDNYRCRICGRSQTESFEKLGRDLCVVHINETTNHDLDNLITRCIDCHNSIMIKIMREKLKETRL